MPQANVKVVIDAVDNASATLNKFSNNFSQFGKVTQLGAKELALLGGGLAAVTAGIGAFAKASIGAASAAQQSMISFKTMLGSAEKADEFMRQMIDFAKKTPFELKGLEEAAKRLLAYGFAQEEVIPNMKILGDISAGVGMEKLPQLILAFGQVKAATKLTGMELRQFTEAGVPLLDELSKVMGMTAADIKSNMEDGMVIPFETVREALSNLTEDGGRFNNLMSEQAKSLAGAWSNFKDTIDIFLRKAGGPFLEVLTKIVVKMTEWAMALQPVVEWLTRHKDIAVIIAAVIGGPLIAAMIAFTVAIWTAMIPAIAALSVALAPYLLAGFIIAGIIAGIILVWKNWETIWNFIEKHTVLKLILIMNPITQLIFLAMKIIENWGKIKDFFMGLWDALISMTTKAVNTLRAIIEPFLALADRLTNAASKVGNLVKSTGSKVGGLLGFASGGMVPGPFGAPQLAVVHGGERVIPQSGFANNFGGGINVSINYPQIASDVDISELSRRVGDEIMKALRRAQNI